jgi:hypothetical protein
MDATRAFERFADSLRLILRDARVTALFLFFVLSISVLESPRADPDMFARVAVGRLVQRDGGVSHADPFAYTPKLDRWVDHEWLSGVIFWRVAELGGDGWLILLSLLCMGAALVTVAGAQRRIAPEGAPVRSWQFACLLPIPWVWRSVIRSQVFTYLLLPAFLFAMADYRKRGDFRVLIPLPFLMLFWANAHGGFVTGLGLLGVFALTSVRDGRQFAAPLWIATAGCIAATLFTPYGIEFWRYMAGALTMDRPAITEWGALIRTPGLALWVGAVAAVWITGLARLKFRVPLEWIVLPSIALIFAIRSGRLSAAFLMTVAVFGLVPVDAVVQSLRTRLPTAPETWRRAAAVCAVFALVPLSLPVARAVTNPGRIQLSHEAYPVGALEWLRENRDGGEVLVGFTEGSYALWRLYPRFLVSIDGRYEEVYPQETVDLVFAALDPTAEGHQDAFEAVRPDFIVVRAEDLGGSGFGAEWNTVYDDGRFRLLEDSGMLGVSPAPPATAPGVVRPIWDPLF